MVRSEVSVAYNELQLVAAFIEGWLEQERLRQLSLQAEASLATLAAIPPGCDLAVVGRYVARIEWARSVHGDSKLSSAAGEALATRDAERRRERLAALSRLWDADEANQRVNAILGRLQNGQLPSADERRLLELAAALFRETGNIA